MMNKSKTLKRRLLWLLLLVPMLGMTSVLFAHTEEAVNIVPADADEVKYYCDVTLRIQRDAILANKALINPQSGNRIDTPQEGDGGTLLGVISALEQYLDKIVADGNTKITMVEITLGSNADAQFVQEVEEVLKKRGIKRIVYFYGNNTRGTSIKVSGNKPAAGGMIKGVVKDAEGPMMLVNVTERDATNNIISHSVTDMNGDFTMRIVNPENTLVVRYSGYYSVYSEITGSDFDITMVEDPGARKPAASPAASSSAPVSGNRRSLSVEVTQAKPKSGDIISGTVKDINGPIPMANVYEGDANGNVVAHSVTDQNGNFRFRLVDPNNHLVAKYPGYYQAESQFTGSNFQITLEFSRPTYSEDDPNYRPLAVPDEKGIYEVVDDMPEFPGGPDAILEFYRTHIHYPATARETRAQGRVVVQFIVNEDGHLSDLNVIKSADNEELDAEAVRVISTMPNWKPGSHDGKPVKVRYKLPVNFRLQ